MSAELQPATRWEWERIVRRVRMPKERKFVAFVLATYASANGTQIRPGERRIAAVCDMGERTVRRHVTALRDMGLLDQIGRGGGPNKAASLYRLTIPTDLLERAELLDPDEGTPATQVASVPGPNSGHLGGLSSMENSGHSGQELRPLRDRTPATAVAAHHVDQSKDQNTSPLVGTSPRQPDESEQWDLYGEASAYLQRLPDLGSSLIENTPDGPMRERVIAAYQAAREAS